ncbi:class I histocompatibility antigen, F10 alpha chain-like [Engraulis encrasicolus]|uniref:class I histocompatibility antigen, F10 alpha chain-like n=1 Tax=Engraulis encrasicolus TaxID=184585 RepID=UPI002FD07745
MKIGVLFGTLWCLHAASAEIHFLKYFYTASAGVPNFPEFVTVGVVDGATFFHYDSDTKKAAAKQDWLEKHVDSQYWERENSNLLAASQTYKASIDIVKSRFNQTGGVHTFQFMYGCQWDDETEEKIGIYQYGYDGEDFISFDVKTMQYTAPVQQAFPTKLKWENLHAELEYWKNYLSNECVEWLKKYVNYGRSSLDRKVDPEVSLVQKGPEVACHATGFYPDSVMITWKKDGVEVDDDVDVGETLPNEDGTFQKRSVLTVSPEEREKAQYSCEVTHKGSIFRPREPRTGGEWLKIWIVLDEVDTGMGMGTGTIIGIIAAVLVVGVGVIAGIVVMVLKKKGEKEYDKASSQDTNSDISNSNPIVRNETEKLNPDPSV